MTRPRVAIAGEDREEVVVALARLGADVVRDAPDVVVSHGGDGTLLRAERVWPLVPKIPVRLGSKTLACPRHGLGAVLERWRADELDVTRVGMLQLRVGRARFYAMNDVVLRNAKPTMAMRFRLRTLGALPELPDVMHTGDGLVAATAFGSTSYFQSVARRRFDVGWGIAFNNVGVPVDPLVFVSDDPLDRVEVEVVRGPAFVVYDNDERMPVLREGHRVEIGPAGRAVTVLGLDALACQACRRRDDGARFHPH